MSRVLRQPLLPGSLAVGGDRFCSIDCSASVWWISLCSKSSSVMVLSCKSSVVCVSCDDDVCSDKLSAVSLKSGVMFK